MTETVKLQVTADASQVNPELAKVQRDLGDLVRKSDDLGAGFTRVGGIARDVFGALGIAASIGAVTSAIVGAGKAAIAYGDDMQKAAAKTGIGAGQFAVLADAARQSDIDVGGLSKSLQKMQVAISQAGSGAKAPLETFAALGIEFDKFRQLSPEDQFLKLADRINMLEDPADRVRAAVELFGKAGADLLPFFEKGAAGIKKATDEIERLGGTLTDEQIAKLAEADDAIKRMETAWSNLARTLTAEVAPALASTFDRYAQGIEFIKKNGLFGTQEQWDAMFAASAPLGSAARTAAMSRGGGSGVLSGGAPGYAAAAAAAGKKSASGGGSWGGQGTGAIKLDDPYGQRAEAGAKVDWTLDPELLYQQQVYDALEAAHDEYSQTMLGKVDTFNQTWLGAALTNNDLLMQSEEYKNVTLGQGVSELVSVAMQQGGALGKFGKAFAIAQTIWSTGTAIMNAFAQVPYPANIGVAAAIAAKGVMQLAQIKKTNIGSGGSVAAPGGVSGGGGGSSLPSNVPAAAASTESDRKSASQIIIQGPILSGQQSADWLIDILRQATDADMVFMTGSSRQAMEIRGG